MMGRILVIEDSEDMRILIAKYLTDGGHVVVTAKDAFEGLEQLEQHKFDLLLTDVIMPKKSGFKLVTEIRRTLRHRLIPVIFVTARNSKQDFMEGMKSGGDDYIIKPFTKDNLLDKVNRYLKNKQDADAYVGSEFDVKNKGKGMLTLDITLLQLSDFGIDIRSPMALPNNTIITINVPLFSEIGLSSNEFKVIHTKHEGNHYIITLAFNRIASEDQSVLGNWMRLNRTS